MFLLWSKTLVDLNWKFIIATNYLSTKINTTEAQQASIVIKTAHDENHIILL